MDPLTAALNLATLALTFGMKIYDDTPAAMRASNAEQWGKFIHNIGDFVIGLQSRINAAAKV